MKKRIFFSLLPLIGGIIVSLIISSSINYSELIKPPLAPPKIIFPIVWSVLYILLGISYFIVNDKKVDETYLKGLLVNLLWPIIFFVFKLYFVSFLWLLLLLLFVITLYIEFYKINKIGALLQWPYIIWVIFALYLNFGIFVLN